MRGLAVAAIAAWPFIPIFFVQVHGRPKFWRKLGSLTYAVVILEWLPLALFGIMFQDFLLGRHLDLGILSWLGVALMVIGVALHV